MTATSPQTSDSAGRTAGALALAVAAAAVGSGVANSAIALTARAAGASDDFEALWPSVYLPLTVLGVLAGAIGWHMVRRRAGDPAAVLRWLVPTVVILSLIPDIAIGVSDSAPGVSWGGVTVLMLMHVAVAVVAVPVYRRFLPLPV
ncbi:DUF6069 family protein [Streptomyces sp. AC555_RSS877]|uniref:DUF6069 family protein n=1 Tax=Streptomyces sp. AC555_RSS877 TaxID=2823688 RepID=UPI001C279E39|nr:DUF6069 family protein [Streptomyces sp. AC555_RSS877]